MNEPKKPSITDAYPEIIVLNSKGDEITISPKVEKSETNVINQSVVSTPIVTTSPEVDTTAYIENIADSPLEEIATPEISSFLEDYESNISKLLMEADENIAALRLTTPAGNNAFEVYKRVLELDPDNQEALFGLKKIAEKYIELSQTSILKQNLLRAERYLQTAKSIDPDIQGFNVVKRKLEEAKAVVKETNSTVNGISQEMSQTDAPETNIYKNESDTIEQVIILEDTILKCLNDDSLKYALAATADINFSSDRDSVYKTIVNKALCSSNYNIAKQAASSISFSSTRDNAYVDIIKFAIKENNYEIANKISGKISFSFTRDKAKKMIIDSIISKND